VGTGTARRATTAGILMLILPLLVVACAGEDSARDDEPARADYRLVESGVARLETRYPEATDSAVRDSVLVAVYCSLVEGKRVPRQFEMFSAEGDRAVESVVRDFVRRARPSLEGLTTEERIEALWGDSWKRDVYVTRDDCARG
jgi:hypothetical protein